MIEGKVEIEKSFGVIHSKTYRVLDDGSKSEVEVVLAICDSKLPEKIYEYSTFHPPEIRHRSIHVDEGLADKLELGDKLIVTVALESAGTIF